MLPIMLVEEVVNDFLVISVLITARALMYARAQKPKTTSCCDFCPAIQTFCGNPKDFVDARHV